MAGGADHGEGSWKASTVVSSQGQGLSPGLSSQQISAVDAHWQEYAVLKQTRPREGDSFQMSKQLTFTGLKKIISTTKFKKNRIKLHMYCFLIKRIN